MAEENIRSEYTAIIALKAQLHFRVRHLLSASLRTHVATYTSTFSYYIATLNYV